MKKRTIAAITFAGLVLVGCGAVPETVETDVTPVEIVEKSAENEPKPVEIEKSQKDVTHAETSEITTDPEQPEPDYTAEIEYFDAIERHSSSTGDSMLALSEHALAAQELSMFDADYVKRGIAAGDALNIAAMRHLTIVAPDSLAEIDRMYAQAMTHFSDAGLNYSLGFMEMDADRLAQATADIVAGESDLIETQRLITEYKNRTGIE